MDKRILLSRILLLRIFLLAGWLCAAQSCFAMQLFKKIGQNRTTRMASEIENGRKNKKICYEAAKRGDVALLRTLIESDAERYIDFPRFGDFEKGITRMGKLVRPLLKYRQRNGRLQGHFCDADIQKDLNQLVCIAVLRLDKQATGMLLDAGADIEATMVTEFDDKQVARLSDTYRNSKVSFYPNKYTPLLYIAGYLDIWRERDERDAGNLSLVRDLVRAGADFRRATPSGRVPYEEACEAVRAVIALEEQECGFRPAAPEQHHSPAGRAGEPEELVGPEDQEMDNQGLVCSFKWLERLKKHPKAGFVFEPQNAKLILGASLCFVATVLLEMRVYQT